MNADKLMDALGGIDDRLIQDAENVQHRKQTPILRRVTVAAAAALLCVALAIPALAAAGVEPAYDALYAVFPAVAQTLKPVNLSCEDNGIKMEVISADIHGSSADVYIAMQDMTGDRIDGTTDLFDSYRIHRAFDSSAHCELVSYDAAQKSATFLIHIDRMDGRPIDGGKMTFSVGEFLSHKHSLETALPELAPASASQAPAVRSEVDIRGGGLGGDAGAVRFLEAQPELTFSPIAGVQLTAYGYIDGQLHIQAHYDDILHYDNHGFIWLTDADGAAHDCAYSVSFWDSERTGSYEEYVFDIPAEAAEGYQVCGDFVSCESLTAGNWQVTFPLKSGQ